MIAAVAAMGFAPAPAGWKSIQISSNKPGFWMATSSYPRFQASAVTLPGELTNDLREQANKLLHQWLKEQSGTREKPTNPYFYERSVRAVYVSSKRLVSIAFNVDTDTGGAHPNHVTTTDTYQFADGAWAPCKLDHFFKKGFDPIKVLDPLVLSRLKDKGAMWAWNGDFKSLEKQSLVQYFLTKANLRIYFSPYDVGPYVQGEFVVDIPYSIIKGWKGSPLN